jgi:predicted RNase H-like HicB family nuclease
MRALQYEVVVVGGPVTVGYYEEDGEWRAIACEFNLVGTGDSREAALAQLKQLVGDYVESCVKEGTDEFLNPYEPEDWQRTCTAREHYLVSLIFAWRSHHRTTLRAQVKPERLADLSRYKDRLVGADLLGVQNAAG